MENPTPSIDAHLKCSILQMSFRSSLKRRSLRPFKQCPPPTTTTTTTTTVAITVSVDFYQRVSIASYANRWYSQRRNVRPSVRLSVTLRYCIKTKKASVIISSPSESQNILISRNIWFITKFDRGYPERGRFLRLGWVRTGDFGDFSTNKPPYLRNGAR